jgi:hypothetical protein
VAAATGRVPQQLYELSGVIDRNVGGVNKAPDADFEDQYFKTNFPDIKDPITKLHYFLQIYSKQSEGLFVGQHVSYYLALPEETKAGFIRMCVNVLTYSGSTIASNKYL